MSYGPQSRYVILFPMSGHSKWSTIKRAKGAADAKRGLTFTKLANAITIAARSGGSGDVDFSPRLRFAVDQARAVNMPKENIQRAIDRGLGKLPGQTLEEVIYEGFGPSKVAVYVEGVTDNRMRTNQEIKNIFDRAGSSLGGPGSTAYMFDKKGEIKIKSLGLDKDEEMLALIDLGAEDVEEYEEGGERHYLVYTQGSELNTMGNKLTQAGYTIEFSELAMKPNITIQLKEGEDLDKVVQFIEKLEDSDDVQKVYTNLEVVE